MQQPGIQRDLLPKLVNGEIKTFIIADLMTPLSKAFKTRQTFIAFLNNLIEEGIAKITTYGMVWDREVNANVITAVTDEAINDGRHEWAKLGFLSRFVIFSYSYSLSNVIEILNSYSEHGIISNKEKLKLPSKTVDIELSKTIADELNPIAVRVGKEFDLYGFRAKINFRCLLKCLAYRNSNDFVAEEEFREFLELADYMNFSYNCIR
jgi:hypothetical protein